MRRKTSIIVSSVAACALLASAFAFNGYAVGTDKEQTPAALVSTLVQSPKETVKTDTTEAKPTAAVLDKDTAKKVVNLSTANVNKNCPKVNGTQSSNNQQTNVANISKADILNKLQNLQTTSKNSNCPKSTADYSALKAKLESLLNGYSAPSASQPSTPTPAQPTTSKPSTPSPAKPSTSAPTNGDYSAFQKKVVDLVNAERAKAGLKPLTMSAPLNKTATLKSQDMAKLNYFDHNSPTYGSPFDMMKKYGISYRTAGENIAMGQTSPEQVMQGWMNSSGHRANILNASYTQIGVGIAKNSAGRLYWTQQFIG